MSITSDDDLIGYCEIHCKTERAFFHADHINRMLELAGLKNRVTGWHSLHEEMQELVDLARENKKVML